MNALHRVMLDSGESVDQLAVELQEFMRSSIRRPRRRSSRHAAAGMKRPSFSTVCCASFEDASLIETRTAHLRAGESDIGKWALDLTSAAVFSLVMRGWGLRYHAIDLLCDDSKPLQAIASLFDNFVGRTDGTEITDGRRNVTIRANLARPIVFGSSAENPTLQIADILAGVTADVLKNPGDPDFAWLSDWMVRHLHEDHVHPDDEVIDTHAIEPRMNLAILRELASRADHGGDPLAGMEDVYATAYARFRSPASRLRRTPAMTTLSQMSRYPR